MKKTLSFLIVLVMLVSLFPAALAEGGSDPATHNAYNSDAAPTTKLNYAKVNSVKTYGTWKFSSWDKKDFQITEDTVITGSWTFTPSSSNPATGDTTRVGLWVALAVLCGGGMGGILIYAKKKKQD